jgi:LemA protein
MNNQSSNIGGFKVPGSSLKWWVVGAVIALLFIGGCSSYNSMVSNEEAVDKAWADVQSSYQRRLDLIPNLVSTVKGYATHESSTLQNVTNARAGIAVTDAEKELVEAGNELQASSATPNVASANKFNKAYDLYINAVHEAYPDLKANTNFMDLQKQLEGTENRINVARDRYNTAVQDYNVKIRRFPANIFAGIFGFEKREAFRASEGADRAPDVQF